MSSRTPALQLPTSGPRALPPPLPPPPSTPPDPVTHRHPSNPLPWPMPTLALLAYMTPHGNSPAPIPPALAKAPKSRRPGTCRVKGCIGTGHTKWQDCPKMAAFFTNNNGPGPIDTMETLWCLVHMLKRGQSKTRMFHTASDSKAGPY